MKRLGFGVACVMSLCALAVASETSKADAQKKVDAAKKASCDIAKKQVSARAEVCPDESAALAGVDCADVKSYKIDEILKLNETCAKRGTAPKASSKSASKKAAEPADEEEPASEEKAAGGKRCRALIDGEVAVEAQEDLSGEKPLSCLKVLRAKVKEQKCKEAAKGSKIEYVMQTQRSSGKWTEGTPTSAACR